MLAERLADAPALLGVEHDAGEGVVHADVVVERAGVLGQRLDGHVERRQRLAVRAVRVRRGDDVRPGGVHRAVDGDRRAVDRPVALDDLAGVVDAYQIALACIRPK